MASFILDSFFLAEQERLASNPTLDVLTRPNWRQSKNIHGEAAWPLVTSRATD